MFPVVLRLPARRTFLLSCLGVLLATCAGAEEVPTSTSTAVAADLTLNEVRPSSICTTCAADRPHDQVWLVSTRQLGCGAAGQSLPQWRVSQLQDRRWASSNSESLFATNGQLRTVVYVHGNRVDSNYAVEGGMRVYRNLVACAGDEPIRFIIWSWCSDKIRHRGPLRDARIKADVADDEGATFGRFLTKFTPADRVGLIGFSYGGRIIGAGLHLVGGGNWQGYRMPVEQGPAQFTAVLWAAALDNNALLPGCENGCAINACPLWLNMVNGCDHALKHYSRIDKCSGIEALGYTGAAGKTTIRSRGIDFRECQVQNLVGCSHESPIYPLSPGVMRQTREIVLP